MRTKKKLKYEVWTLSKIRNLIRSINKSSDNYNEKYMKIKFNSDDELPLNETIQIFSMIIAVRAVFHENHKYYPQFILEKCFYKL